MRNLNEPWQETPLETFTTQALRTDAGRESLCEAVTGPILNQIRLRSPWLGFLFKNVAACPSDAFLLKVRAETGFSSQRPDLADRAVEQIAAKLADQCDHLQAWVLSLAPSKPLLLTREAWDEARGQSHWVLVGPAVYETLMKQPWFVAGWNPTTRMELARSGYFGAYQVDDTENALALRASHTLKPGTLMFGVGPLGEAETTLSVGAIEPLSPRVDVVWRAQLTSHLKIYDPQVFSVRTLEG